MINEKTCLTLLSVCAKINEIAINIDPTEVDAYTWLSYEQIGTICKQIDPLEKLHTFNAHVHLTGMCQLPFDILTIADYNQKENLTSGTRFALEQLYRLKLKK